MARPPRPDISAAFRAQIEEVKGKRARIVLAHIMKHGQVTTEDLTKRYGYQHPPRAIADVREAGIPLEKFIVQDAGGRRIAAYRLGDPATVRGHKLEGRSVLPRALAVSLFAVQGGRCAVCGHEYERRYLQIDHRVPFKIGGDPPISDETKFMLLCASCQRRKSWSCENCPNSAGSNDMWLTRITGAAGAHVWSRRYGGAGQEGAKQLAATADGFALVGCFGQTAAFGGATLTSAGMADAVIAKYDALGGHLWSQSFGGAANDCAVSASLTGAGNLLVAGFFNGSMTIGSTSLTSMGNEDVSLVELAGTNGSPLAVRGGGGTGSDLPSAVVSVGAEFALVGSVTDTSTIFGHVISGGGMSDGFVVRTQR